MGLKLRKFRFSFTRVPFRSKTVVDNERYSFFDVNVFAVMFGNTPDYRSISFFVFNFLVFISIRKRRS